jgi:hypothetical protein
MSAPMPRVPAVTGPALLANTVTVYPHFFIEPPKMVA